MPLPTWTGIHTYTHFVPLVSCHSLVTLSSLGTTPPSTPSSFLPTSSLLSPSLCGTVPFFSAFTCAFVFAFAFAFAFAFFSHFSFLGLPSQIRIDGILNGAPLFFVRFFFVRLLPFARQEQSGIFFFFFFVYLLFTFEPHILLFLLFLRSSPSPPFILFFLGLTLFSSLLIFTQRHFSLCPFLPFSSEYLLFVVIFFLIA